MREAGPSGSLLVPHCFILRQIMVPGGLVVIEYDQRFRLAARERPFRQIGGTDDDPRLAVSLQQVDLRVGDGVLDHEEAHLAIGDAAVNVLAPPIAQTFDADDGSGQFLAHHALKGQYLRRLAPKDAAVSKDALEVFERLLREEVGYGGNARRIRERPHGSVARKVPGVEGRNSHGAGMHHVQRGTPGGGLRVVKQ